MSDVGTQLIRYDAMCTAIAECHAVDEVKDIRDKARAIEMYARQAQNTEAEEQARQIRLRAERKCGQILAEREMHGGDRRSSSAGSNLKLSDLHISGDQSSQWQRLAAVPDDIFEQALSEPNASTAGIITRHEVAEREPAEPIGNLKALWLWGRLQDFEREGLLTEEPSSMLDGIHDHMRATILEMAPRIAEWLKEIGE